ncbi:MAG: hypothetical protein AAFZ65_02505 [Planctomycetota bacterium]
MQPRPCIFKLHPDDNVGTSLADLAPGECLPVVEASGERIAELVVTSRVPRFFKLALVELAPGTAVIKWGRQIGRIHRTPDSEFASDAPLVAGAVVHLGNFVPSTAVVEAFGDGVATPCTRIAEQPGAVPFEVGSARRGLHVGDPILVADVEPAREGQGTILDGLTPDTLLGIAVSHVKRGRELHWGALAPSRFHYERTDGVRLKERVEQIRSHYQFLAEMQRLS